jgi:serine/threonine-protein kinase mTOR
MAQELLLWLKTELREMPQEELLAFLDEFNHSIFDMISSADTTEKKGGVLAISECDEATGRSGCVLISIDLPF